MTRTDMEKSVRRHLEESAANLALASSQAAPAVAEAADCILGIFRKGGQLLICGNGGSAADSQHLAAELMVRFERERSPLAAVALTTDTSIITAEANDHGFATVFSRQVLALGRRGDALLAISTSGNSANVVNACIAAGKKGMKVIGLTGPGGGRMSKYCHITIKAAGGHTAAVQECQLALEHALCRLIERGLAR